VPLAGLVAAAIARQLPAGYPSETLVFAGPGGSNGVPAGTRGVLTRDNLRRVYQTALAKVADPSARLGYTARRVLVALREAGSGQTAEMFVSAAWASAPGGHRARGPVRTRGRRAGRPTGG
jgi:hypothetical protein